MTILWILRSLAVGVKSAAAVAVTAETGTEETEGTGTEREARTEEREQREERVTEACTGAARGGGGARCRMVVERSPGSWASERVHPYKPLLLLCVLFSLLE
jgi:hypothetical protein